MEENNVNTKPEGKGQSKVFIGVGAVALVVVVTLIVILALLLGGPKEIAGKDFKERLEKLEWEVQDYTKLMAFDTSGETEGMKEMLMAQKDEAAAIFVAFEDEKGAKEYYDSNIEKMDESLEEEAAEKLNVKRVNKGNYQSLYIWGEADGEKGWMKLSRVGKTVVMLQSSEEKDFKAADKALGY